MSQKKKLFLLDAMALIYRAYYALNKNPRINSKGLNTSAILGFGNSLMEVLQKEQPTHIGVAFDTMAPTQRAEGYEDYKANREALPEDIATALPYIFQMLEGFNIPILFEDGYEADDIVGTIAKKAEKDGFEVYMMTSDKDFGQLVSENIFMYKPARMGNKAEILGVEEICKKYEIQQPEQLIDILGLWGDASDNIPGIPGIGEKTAKQLVKQYGSVENLIEHADELKGKQKENVLEYAEQGRKSKELATIITDVPVSYDPEDLELSKPNFDELNKLFDELEFRQYKKRVSDLFSDAGASSNGEPDLFSESGDTAASQRKTIESEKHDYKLLQEEKDIKELIEKLEKNGSFCFDTETSSLEATQAELVGISFSIKKGEAWYIPFPKDQKETKDKLEIFRSLFEDNQTEKTGQNLKYDITVLKNYGLEVNGPLFDTMIAHYLLEPDMRHNMDYLADVYLDYKPVSIETLIGKKGKSQKDIRTANINKVAEYACEDADITLQLKQVFEPKLKEYNLTSLFREIEIPLIPVLASMEKEGVMLDTDALKDISQRLNGELEKIEAKIYELAGEKFNIASTKQLGQVLYEKLKITDKPKLTKTKQYSTSEDVLQKLKNKHEIVEYILEYRSVSKLKSTYVDALPELINPYTGRLHTTFNQTIASTGRLSSNKPNLQNIPIRTERGKEIRKAFVPRGEEYTLLAADYSQIELRLIAELSQDETMLKAFREGQDIHTTTAAKVYKVKPEEVDKEMRRKAKTVNFGIIYGISAHGLSERLNIKRGKAKEIIDAYFEQYPAIRKYMDDQIAFAREHGYVQTLKSRRRYLRDINSKNSVVRGFAERNAINAPIQGSSADMIKIAMINIHNYLTENNLKTKMTLQVHDELIFDMYNDEIETVKNAVKKYMKEAMPLSIPVVVDINEGNNWLEAH
ncbi:MAG: DNA polymerase I [Bacteroidales bacterium]|nr:DNA polymerase I [Bacteroidales bacterium]MCF8326673.1 DNA polymerase I [Bacteroidales bacterium]